MQLSHLSESGMIPSVAGLTSVHYHIMGLVPCTGVRDVTITDLNNDACDEHSIASSHEIPRGSERLSLTPILELARLESPFCRCRAFGFRPAVLDALNLISLDPREEASRFTCLFSPFGCSSFVNDSF